MGPMPTDPPGDIPTAPLPVETLDLLASLGGQVGWVRGNADRELVSVARFMARRTAARPRDPALVPAGNLTQRAPCPGA